MARAMAAVGRRRGTTDVSVPAMVVGGLALTAGFVLLALVAMENATYDTWATLFVTPVLIVVSLPVLTRQAAREGDRRLFWFLVAALVAKLVIGTFLRYFNTVEINGGTDSNKYHDAGLALYQKFRDGNFDTSGLGDVTGTNFIRFVTGLVYAVTGPSRASGFVVFSWLAFWGQFFFYRAFALAVPEGRKRTYARFVFFLPSILFWPSSLGKEAWMMFGLGIAAYGVARILTGSTVHGVVVAALGMWLAAFVRPYMPGMLAVGLAFGYVFLRTRDRHRELAPIVKVLSLSVLVVLSLILVARSEEFLEERDVSTDEGVTSTLGEVTRRSSQGGSEFVPSVLKSPLQAPMAMFTVLFRPLVFEAHTPRALMSALEGMFLFGLALIRLPWILSALKNLRHRPYVMAAFVYTGAFVFAFSSLANFGQLVRQRSLLLPLAVLFLCIPATRRASSQIEETRSHT
ncbi:MAG: hypothetical protein ACRDKB_08575 [Actinomycetota bacterium]